MPIYNAPLLDIDPQETRRYAGLHQADFDAHMIEEACMEARLLAKPQGIWTIYDYDTETQTVQAEIPFHIKGKQIAKHLALAEKVILLAATVGDEIETMVTKHFEEGHYAFSVLLDAAATTAVEQIADAMEKTIQPRAAAKGYSMRWRFSPGYGDWPIEQQPEMLRLSHAAAIGIHLTTSMMLVPRKSITAIIGLSQKPECTRDEQHHCALCARIDCPARNTEKH